MATIQADDWQSNRTLVQCNQHALTNQIGCDVTFQVGTTKIEKISAHKVLLANRSSVFFTMFYGSLPESDMITIPDIEPEVFREFLGYIYTDQVILRTGNVCLILYAAHKYSMQNLMLKCSSFLQSNIFIDNVCTIMENAHTFDLQTLFQKCKTFILDNSSEILTSFGLINFCSRCLKSIISSDGLGENECDIFNVVMVWAENQCNKMNMPITTENKRHVLGDLLYEIRFPLMDAEQFTEIAETGILTEVDQLDVFKVISKGKTASTKFNSSCRVEQICILRHPKKVPVHFEQDTAHVHGSYQPSSNSNRHNEDFQRTSDMQPLLAFKTLADYKYQPSTSSYRHNEDFQRPSDMLPVRTLANSRYTTSTYSNRHNEDFQRPSDMLPVKTLANSTYTTSTSSYRHNEDFQRPSDMLIVSASATLVLKGIVLYPTDRQVGIVKVTCNERNRSIPSDPYYQKQNQKSKDVEQLLFVTELGEKDKGRFVHIYFVESFRMLRWRTYSLQTTFYLERNKEYSNYLPLCQTFQKRTKRYNTIEEIPTDSRSPFTLENESQESGLIIGLSYIKK